MFSGILFFAPLHGSCLAVGEPGRKGRKGRVIDNLMVEGSSPIMNKYIYIRVKPPLIHKYCPMTNFFIFSSLFPDLQLKLDDVMPYSG